MKLKGWRIEAAPKRSEGIAYSRNNCLLMVDNPQPQSISANKVKQTYFCISISRLSLRIYARRKVRTAQGNTPVNDWLFLSH
jgi:hypothetical protein